MRPNLEPTELGVIIRANHKILWARNNSNPTMEEYYDAYVYEHVWMHKYKAKRIRQIRFESPYIRIPTQK